MELSRREFLKFSGTGVNALVLLKSTGFTGSKAAAVGAISLKRSTKESTTCPSGTTQFGERADLLATPQRRVQILKSNGSSKAVSYNTWAQQPSGAIATGMVTVFPFLVLFRREKQLVAEQKSEVEGGTG